MPASVFTNNTTERNLRCIPLVGKAWLFCGSDRGGKWAAIIYTLIQTAYLDDVDPKAKLANALSQIADCRASSSTNFSDGTEHLKPAP